VSLDPPSIEAFLVEIKQRVDARLERYFSEKRTYAKHLSAPSVELVDALHDFTQRGGKRTRPAVLVAGHMAVNTDTQLESLLDACAGLELLQSYLLVHDDWMDQDDERRGGPALHKLFADKLGDKHLGASLAILAGDLGNGFALELIAGSPMPDAQRSKALRVLWDMQQDVVWGQGLDLLAYPNVALIQRLKTGSYSVKGPLLLGATIGNARATHLVALGRYADPVGQAFQARDDVLGVFGDPEKTGKPRGNDLRAGKRTALIEEAEQRLSESELAPIRSVLGRADAKEDEIGRAMELLDRSGVRAAIDARVERLCTEAEAALQAGTLEARGAELLQQLARKFAYRDH
jgi:geranylgeranyl diphosphate synthase type I